MENQTRHARSWYPALESDLNKMLQAGEAGIVRTGRELELLERMQRLLSAIKFAPTLEQAWETVAAIISQCQDDDFYRGAQNLKIPADVATPKEKKDAKEHLDTPVLAEPETPPKASRQTPTGTSTGNTGPTSLPSNQSSYHYTCHNAITKKNMKQKKKAT